ncbi:hypothetical protein [Amycolatopsis magusensis]|uniref:Uncharacterized protein n=1 Tax=Amycolatopsis magusensis TaxID=882444 RepID=A0ABS4PWN7_9PSEU|nr:hypothetical protein [Amycolatopsis magusensis]MBP2183844.1 hypothetical protein [Amycolatopsis magusensis]
MWKANDRTAADHDCLIVYTGALVALAIEREAGTVAVVSGVASCGLRVR